MARTNTKRKPTPPRQIVVQDRVVVEADRLQLPNNAAVVVEEARRADPTKGVRGNDKRVRRLDVFDDLRSSMDAGAYDAARRLERDLTIRAGEHDRGTPTERLDNDYGRCRQDTMVAAGQRVDDVMARLDAVDGLLLSALMRPDLAMGLSRWTDIAAKVTGAAQHAVLCDRVRGACLRLARAYG